MANEVKIEQDISQILDVLKNTIQRAGGITGRDDNRKIYSVLMHGASKISRQYGFSVTNKTKRR